MKEGGRVVKMEESDETEREIKENEFIHILVPPCLMLYEIVCKSTYKGHIITITFDLYNQYSK